jgi:hypothetical protein
MSALDQTQVWQQLRDEASYIRQSYENRESREAQLYATALGNEAMTGKNNFSTTTSIAINNLNK